MVSLQKTPYVALIGAVIGQVISFKKARKTRSNLYQRLGTSFTAKDVDELSDDELIEIGINERE